MKSIDKKKQLAIVALIVASIVVGFIGFKLMFRKKNTTEIELIKDWYNFMLLAETETEGYRFPITARFYAYAGIAAYGVVNSPQENVYLDLNDIFIDLTTLPNREKAVNNLPALNACYSELCRLFFIGGKNDLDNKNRILAESWNKKLSEQINDADLKYSVEYGNKVARSIYEWASGDTMAHRAELSIYDRNYKYDTIPGKWRASARFPLPPMLPYWGETRRFIANSADFIAAPPTHYSTDQNSNFYKEALEIYSLHNPLSQDNKWIAEFWDDDHPGQVFSHPGHWLAIALQVFENERPKMDLMTECMFKLGIALNDAAVNCWRSKYKYKLERPEHYIQQYIDPEWEPYGVSPSHPSYPSGHSAFGSAAAEVLSFYFGDNYTMTDNSHQNRTIYKVKSRKFISFRDMAMENSLSRMYLGVHYKSDCEEGRKLGEKIGKAVINLPLKHEQTHSMAD